MTFNQKSSTNFRTQYLITNAIYIFETIRNHFSRYVSEKIKNVARSDCEVHEKIEDVCKQASKLV